MGEELRGIKTNCTINMKLYEELSPKEEFNATIEVAKAIIGQNGKQTAREVADLSSYIVKRIAENVDMGIMAVFNRCMDNEKLREE